MIIRFLILLLTLGGAYAFFSGGVVDCSLLLRCCGSVFVLFLGGGVFLGMDLLKSKKLSPLRLVSVRRAGWIDYGMFGGGCCVLFGLGVFYFLFLGEPVRHILSSVHEEVVANGWGGGSGDPLNEGGGEGHADTQREQVSGQWLFQENLERSLPKRSDHRLSAKPEVFLELENEEDAQRLFHSRIHLRLFSFSRFNGDAWSAVMMPATQVSAPISFYQPEQAKLVHRIKHRIYLPNNSNGHNVFAALSGVTETDIPLLTRLSSSLYLLPQLDDPAAGYQYDAVSASVSFKDLDDRIAPAKSDPVHLELPTKKVKLIREIQKTAKLWDTEGSLKNKLVALRRYLRENYEYSLKVDNVGDLNSLENFLCAEKRGYCEHFASASAMFCRALGVPSRIAYGWSGGRFYQSQNMFVFRAKDAHAWTEIKLKGYGWVVFDTTPADANSVPETQVAPVDDPVPNPEKIVAEQYAQEQQSSLKQETPTLWSREVKFFAWGVIGLGGLLAVFLVWRYRWQRRWTKFGVVVGGGSRRSPDYFVCFQEACASLGYPMSGGRTLKQQVEQLRENGLGASFHEELLDYHYGVFYGELTGSSKEEKKWKRLIHAWRKQHQP